MQTNTITLKINGQFLTFNKKEHEAVEIKKTGEKVVFRSFALSKKEELTEIRNNDTNGIYSRQYEITGHDQTDTVVPLPEIYIKFKPNVCEIGKDKMSIDYTYNVQAKQTGITNLLQDLKDAGFKLKDLKTEQSTLEKIFVSLVKENNEI